MKIKLMESHISQNLGTVSKKPQVRFYVYRDKYFVVENAFCQNHISIGSSPDADLVLDHEAVSAMHAFIYFSEGQAVLSNRFPNNGLRLNGLSVEEAELLPKSIIDVGPYSIQVSIHESSSHEAIQNENRSEKHFCNPLILSDTSVIANVSEKDIFPSNIPDPSIFVKEGTINQRADESLSVSVKAPSKTLIFQKALNSIRQLWVIGKSRISFFSAVYSIKNKGKSLFNKNYFTVKQDQFESNAPNSIVTGSFFNQTFSQDAPLSLLYEDDIDDDGNIWEASFSLARDLAGAAVKPEERKPANQVQIFKTIGKSVLDITFSNTYQKHFIRTSQGFLKLTRNRSRNRLFLTFNKGLAGHLVWNQTVKEELKTYKCDENLVNRRKGIYRIPLSENSVFVVEDGEIRHRVLLAREKVVPDVKSSAQKQPFNWKPLGSSLATHVIFILCLMICGFFQEAPSTRHEPRFVQLDQTLLDQLEAKKKVLPKPEKITPPKQEPIRVAKNDLAVKSASQVAVKTPTPKSIKTATQPSRHPKAGGGFGKGNIQNRNINQAGLLNILGDTAGSQEIVQITNIDAITVPGETEKNFKVAGIKGSLGNGKLTMASLSGNGIFQTKGSQQVLRSAGTSGDGQVAALERGRIGKNKVQGMVTAKLSRTVKIQGGMSREMVKRIIDQHLDDITYCYESALMSNPSIMGRAVFEWKILMSGSVGEIRIVSSSINSSNIHECIKDSIQSWQFPKPVGAEVVVNYPFVFDLVAF